MIHPLGRDACLWIDGIDGPSFPTLDGDASADVAVVGGGIVGLTAALLLRRAGAEVVLLEAGRVGLGVTARATVKVSTGHGMRYSKIASRHGDDAVRAYGGLNLEGMRLIRELIDAPIACDWEEREHWVWASTADEAEHLVDEAAAEQTAGLKAELAEPTELPFETTGGLRLQGQAQFHPVRYLHGVAALAAEAGVRIHEHTRATDVRAGEVTTERGVVRAEHVIVATNYPILNEGFSFLKLAPRREYAVAARIGGASVPEQMYVGAGSPLRSIRTAPHEGGRVLIAVGEDHPTGERADEAERPRRLAAWVTETFGLADFVFHWSNQDSDPIDALPLIGEVRDGLHIAAGFGGWGITSGTGAAILLADAIGGKPRDAASTFDPRRSATLHAPVGTLRQGMKALSGLLSDRVRIPVGKPEDLGPGEAAVLRVGGKPVAAHRDDDGRLHQVSAVCTHMGCLVRWNEAERSWDCPCHGSRFDPDGAVLHAPAVKPLPPVTE